MRNIICGVAGLIAVAAMPGAADAQGTRDRLARGSWTCSVTNADPMFTGAAAQFDANGAMTLSFFISFADPQMTMGIALTGTWSYDPVRDAFSEKFTGARIDGMKVRGTPMSRAEYPGGEAPLVAMEQEFLSNYASSPLYFTTVTSNTLVLTDSENAKINCSR